MCLAQFSGLLDFNIHFCSLKEGFFPRGLLTHRSCASQVFSCGSFVYIDLIGDSFFFFLSSELFDIPLAYDFKIWRRDYVSPSSR